MNFLKYVKSNLTSLPYSVGSIVSKAPYSIRPGIGKVYTSRINELEKVEQANTKDLKEFIFKNTKNIATYAHQNIPFYKKLYNENSVDPMKFRGFNDLSDLPIITKNDLQKVDLEMRSSPIPGRYLVNTGGSSGKPLEFYIQPSSIGHEWAHMHKVWRKLNFNQKHLRIVFGGRADIKGTVIYDSARHQININIYAGWKKVADELLLTFEKYSPKYLHGYPSAIFDFIIWLSDNDHPLIHKLKHNIKGLFLGSEFPSNQQRVMVEEMLSCPSVSWYGHTERSVLAYEKNQHGIYHPFTSYGFAEAFKEENGFRLIATSYHNYASPLIRYDTEDYIKPYINEDLLESFSIEKGRNGEFILDSDNNKIFLTALIFGRHHDIFNYIKHIQIHQNQTGHATILLVARYDTLPKDLNHFFDSSNVNLKFIFKEIRTPYRTKSGKIPLLVKEL